MEKKEPINVSLQTLLLIIAIIIILIMAVVIGILYNKNIKLENKGNELKNVINTECETKVNNSIIENTVSKSSNEDTDTAINININTNANTTNNNNNINININTNTNVNKTTTETTENNSTPSKEGIKLVQFDTEFYKLEDLALEYRTFGNIKNYKDFEYDLDGDGTKDIITIRHSTKKENIYPDYIQTCDIYKIQLNGKNFMDTENGEIITSIDNLYIVDLNKNDNKIEVVFEGYGPSDDPHYIVFSKDGSTMKAIASMDGMDLMTDIQGTIVVDNLDRSITPKVYDRYYIMQNNKIEENKSDISKIKNIIFKSDNLYFINGIDDAKNNVNAQSVPENGEFEFNILEFKEQSGSLYVKLNDGRKGLLVRVRGYLAG